MPGSAEQCGRAGERATPAAGSPAKNGRVPLEDKKLTCIEDWRQAHLEEACRRGGHDEGSDAAERLAQQVWGLAEQMGTEPGMGAMPTGVLISLAWTCWSTVQYAVKSPSEIERLKRKRANDIAQGKKR